ncbi:MAG: hypothetical protein CMJ73_05135 [Planctomycetaceae bacterium]|nr:hypothetical protein [Planctomycetaceae bacterium]
MARHQEDREDILREATALVERVELDIDDLEDPVVVGFRRDSGPAFFFGADPVYQFNSQFQLRRGYRQGCLLKAEAGRLIELRRERTKSSMNLVRHELDEKQLSEFMQQLTGHLQFLGEALTSQHFRLVGQVPVEGDVVGRVSRWLAEMPAIPTIAEIPNA